jgi:uncharacterized protein (DUF952 family)
MSAARAQWVFKIAPREAWADACRVGTFGGSADDRRDGFIHLSALHQLSGTLARHFKGRTDLVVIKLDSDALGDALRWEPARNGDLFPHLYAPLPTTAACAVLPLSIDAKGEPIVPEDI